MNYRSFIFFLVSLISFSQEKISFYFEVNKYELLGVEKDKLSLFIHENKNKKLYFYSLKAMTDERGSKGYNDELAIKRGEYILNILSGNLKMNGDIFYEPVGEVKGNFKESRRVDLLYTIEVPIADKFINSKRGDTIRFETLNFIPDSEKVLEYSKPILNDVFIFLKDNLKYKVKILGHICCDEKHLDKVLAYKRCKFIYDFLVNKGISNKRLSFESFNATLPIFPMPENNEYERIMNRRVEVVILEK